jgi:hypothetical protein
MLKSSTRATIARTTALAVVATALAATPAAAQLTTNFDVLFSDKDQKVGVAFDAAYVFVTDNENGQFSGTANLEGETSLSGTSLAFKNAFKADTSFAWFPPQIGKYAHIVAKPISFEASDEFDKVNYKGSVNLMTEVPATKDFGNWIAEKIFHCSDEEFICTSNGLLVGVGASANVKVEREAGRTDRSKDVVGTFNAAWRLPLRRDLTFVATYDWQSDSPDGSSSEASEVGVVYTILGCDTGIKLSFIDGEFLPGQQRREAVRIGLQKILGKTC